MMRVLVTGDRDWKDFDTILAALTAVMPCVIVEGGATGADLCAEHAAAILELPVERYPANWANGRAAGPIRNRLMLDSKPDLVLAFHDDLARSRGTKDCVEEAQRRGIPVLLHRSRQGEGS